MNLAFENPLRPLVQGPLDDFELMEFGVSIMPDCPRSEMMDVLTNLRNQYLENPHKIIIPHWWQDDPETFRDKMNEELSFYLSEENLTDEKNS